MNWKEYYRSHTETAEQAVQRIHSGDRVVVMHACGEPSYLLDAMVSNYKAYRDGDRPYGGDGQSGILQAGI